MKKLFKKMLDIPVPYAVVFGVVATGLIVLTVQGEVTMPIAIMLSLLAIMIVLQIYLGSIVIKTVFASIVILYTTAIYTSAVMTIHGNVIEPYLLTIAAVTLFLAQTYSKDEFHYGLRSRALWSSLLVFILITIKLALVLSDYSFIITEVVGLNVLIIYIALWRYWLNNARKTRMTYPTVVKEETIEKLKFIHIEDRLNAKESRWLGGNLAGKNSNAYPYIYNEVLKAAEEGLSLVIVYTLMTDKFYDVGEVKVNKSKSIPYMYIEAKENDYIHDALESFSEEVYRYSK